MEYANHPGETQRSEQRRRNGAETPFGISSWCLGNEMDGPWQIGFKTADEYGGIAVEAARAMRMIDPDLELVACGELELRDDDLRRVGRDRAHPHLRSGRLHLAAHLLLRVADHDVRPLSRPAPVDMDQFIDAVVATATRCRARGRHPSTSTSPSTSGT